MPEMFTPQVIFPSWGRSSAGLSRRGSSASSSKPFRNSWLELHQHEQAVAIGDLAAMVQTMAPTLDAFLAFFRRDVSAEVIESDAGQDYHVVAGLGILITRVHPD
jgi:hypothetical protein